MRRAAAVVLLVAGCGGPAAPDGGTGADAGRGLDAGAADAGGGLDAGEGDGGSTDAGATDSGTLDASVDDAGTTAADAGRAPPRLAGWWGGYGTEPGEFIEPSSVELDSAGTVYVAGHENRYQTFTRDGALIAIYGSAGTGDGQFNHPHGLAVDRWRGDLVYVGDQENSRLQVFQPDGTFVRQWGDALFQHIHDVGIDPATGDLFVGDYELDTVRKFSSTGELLATFGGTGRGPGEFMGVWGISTDSAGDVYVTDTFNRRVQVLSRDGAFLRQWGDFEGVPFVKPTGVYVDREDTVYVCDSLAALVLLYDRAGTPLERWDLAAIAGFDVEPEDIVLDAAGEHIYLGEVRQHRVLHLVR